MANPYETQTISGYNSSPPPDDGSQDATNEIKWSTHKTKLADPIKTLTEAVNTETLSAFGLTLGQTYSSHSSNYSILEADRGKFLSVTGTTTITLLDVATAGTGFPIVIINNGTANVTIDGDGSETINGSTTITLLPGEMALLTTDGTAWVALVTKHRARFVKGSDIASANALTLGSDGNYFDVTGNTAITSINTVEVGTIVKLHFDGALTLTHHATNLILPRGISIATAAGDEAEFIEYATGDWRCTNYQRSAGIVTADFSTGVVDQVAIGNSAIGQGELKSALQQSTGSGSANLIFTGGVYTLGWGIAGGVTVGSHSNSSFTAGMSVGVGTFYLQARYIQASPPYDLGHGEIPLFIFAVIDNTTHDVIMVDVADDAPWHYNGPTNIKADRYDREGRSYRDMKPIEYELLSRGTNIQSAMKSNDRDRVMDRFINEEKKEYLITQSMKNADMPIIPHPFLDNDLHDKTVVAINPNCDCVHKLSELRKEGLLINDLIHEKYLVIDNEHIDRGFSIQCCNIKWK